MRLRRLFILLLALAVLFGGIFAFIHFKNARTAQFLASRANPVIAVTAETARQDRWQDTLPAVGTLKAVNGVDVAPEVPGIVTALPFVSGQTVKAGDVLAQLDADVETANRNSALAQLRIFQDNYDRTNKLVIGRDVAVETLVQIRFQIQAQQATVDSLDALIAKKTIRAPFAGRVGINNLNLGQYVQPGTVITTLQDISSLQVEFSIGAEAAGGPRARTGDRRHLRRAARAHRQGQADLLRSARRYRDQHDPLRGADREPRRRAAARHVRRGRRDPGEAGDRADRLAGRGQLQSVRRLCLCRQPAEAGQRRTPRSIRC